MTVTATPTSPRMLTRDRIRMAMRDLAGAIPNTGVLNVLLDNVEFSDEEMDNAILFTVEWYNSITPVSSLLADSINNFVLYQGVVSFLMNSESLRQLRNQALVQDGEIAPIGIDDKAQLYSQMSQLAYQRFTESAKSIKIQMNMESAYGGFGSGYRGTGRRSGW